MGDGRKQGSSLHRPLGQLAVARASCCPSITQSPSCLFGPTFSFPAKQQKILPSRFLPCITKTEEYLISLFVCAAKALNIHSIAALRGRDPLTFPSSGGGARADFPPCSQGARENPTTGCASAQKTHYSSPRTSAPRQRRQQHPQIPQSTSAFAEIAVKSTQHGAVIRSSPGGGPRRGRFRYGRGRHLRPSRKI